MKNLLKQLEASQDRSHVISGIPFTFNEKDFIPVKIKVNENDIHISSIVSKTELTIAKNNCTVTEKDDYIILEALNVKFILKLNVDWEMNKTVEAKDIVINTEPPKATRKPVGKRKPLTKK